MITTTWEWPAAPYNGALPPPLCFTEPAGFALNQGEVLRGGIFAITPRMPKLMMDPTDRSTWQRPYRFT